MHLQNLVALAEADGILHEDEIDLLNKIGRHYGLKTNEILEIFRDQNDFELKIPANYDQKINQLFEMVKLMMVDNVIDEKEMQLAKDLCQSLKFADKIIELLIEANQKPNMSMWEWEKFKKAGKQHYFGKI